MFKLKTMEFTINEYVKIKKCQSIKKIVDFENIYDVGVYYMEDCTSYSGEQIEAANDSDINSYLISSVKKNIHTILNEEKLKKISESIKMWYYS